MTLLLFLIAVVLCDSAVVQGSEVFDYECLPKNGAQKRERFASPLQDPVFIQVSNHVLNQISSRVYAIYLKEHLGYNDIVLQEVAFDADMREDIKLYHTFEGLLRAKMPALNLAVWMPPDYHRTPPEVQMAGPFTNGRFGWFFPKKYLRDGDLPPVYPYSIFSKPNTEYLRQFIMDPDVLNEIRILADTRCPNCTKGLYKPIQCEKYECATLLAPFYSDTEFVRERVKDGVTSKKFLVLHRVPSEIINSNVDYEMITMPHCEQMMSNSHTNCKYELMPLLKYFTTGLTYSKALHSSFLKLDFGGNGLQRVFELYDNATRRTGRTKPIGNKNTITKFSSQLKDNVATYYKNLKYRPDVNKLYNSIACEWMRESKDIYDQWFDVYDDMEIISIGGIFPITAAGAAYSGLLPAVEMAENAINMNATILPNIRLHVLKMDGNCRAPEVMKSFINIYMNQDPVLGVLGPACSETVEPIAGVSKHFKMSVISYSAEGASFRNRTTYPYFFRTIGENQQYEHVYLQLMQHLKWSRVAALTEDGQKYTEYISHCNNSSGSGNY